MGIPTQPSVYVSSWVAGIPGHCEAQCATADVSHGCVLLFLGVFVTREHVRHNKSGIAHRGRTRINHLRELPTKLNHFAAVGRLPCPAEPVNHRCTFGMRGAETSGRQPVVP
jgi:hypothetical protein